MYNIVAQYVIKVKTVPPGKETVQGVLFSLTVFKGSLWQECVVSLLNVCHGFLKSGLFVRARNDVNTQSELLETIYKRSAPRRTA